MNQISRNTPTFSPFNAFLVAGQNAKSIANACERDKENSICEAVKNKSMHIDQAPFQARVGAEGFDEVWNIEYLYNSAKEDYREIFRFFTTICTDLNVKNIQSDIPWDIIIENNKPKIVGLFKRWGVDLNQQDDEGYSLMHLAVAEGSLDMVKALCAHDMQIDLQNLWGRTALHNAIELENCHDIAMFLISKSNNLHLQDSSGQTLLHIAATENRIEIARLLIKNGANPDWLNDRYETALDIALEKDHVEMITLLKDNMYMAL